MRRAPSATAESDAFRAVAFRVAEGVRAAEELLAHRRRDRYFESDRAAWADLRDAVDRLVALVAEHEPVDLVTGDAPVGRHTPEREAAA